MKRIIIIGSLISCALLAPTGEVRAQSGIEQVLKNIETNNKELQANAQLIASQKLEAKTDNNLPDPTLSYAHLWGAKDKNETIGELVVSQSFDFPSLYATRNKLNRLKAGAFDSQAIVFRQEKLLLAKEVCLDIIMLRQQKHILEERLRNAEELAKMYAKRLQTGDANALETNKINLELLNVKTETSLTAGTEHIERQHPRSFRRKRVSRNAFPRRLSDAEIGSAFCRPHPDGVQQRKPRCPQADRRQQVAMAPEVGTRLSPEHGNRNSIQRSSSRLLLPAFREP